jgi:hypothetical protein
MSEQVNPSRQKRKVSQDAEKARLPAGPVTLFNRRERGRDAAPCVGDCLLLPVVIGVGDAAK